LLALGGWSNSNFTRLFGNFQAEVKSWVPIDWSKYQLLDWVNELCLHYKEQQRRHWHEHVFITAVREAEGVSRDSPMGRLESSLLTIVNKLIVETAVVFSRLDSVEDKASQTQQRVNHLQLFQRESGSFLQETLSFQQEALSFQQEARSFQQETSHELENLKRTVAELSGREAAQLGQKDAVAAETAVGNLVATTQMQTVQTEVAELRTALDGLRAELAAARAENADLRAAQARSREAALEVAELRTALDGLRAELAAARAENADLRADQARSREDALEAIVAAARQQMQGMGEHLDATVQGVGARVDKAEALADAAGDPAVSAEAHGPDGRTARD